MNTWTTLVHNLPKNVIFAGGNMHAPVLPGGNFCRITYWVLIGDITPCYCRLQLSTSSGGFRGGRAGSSLPLDDGPTTSRYAVVVLASANFWSNYCKTCTLEYSEWLPPVAFSQLNSAPNSFPAGASPRTQLGELTVLLETPIIIILQRLTRRVSVIRMTNRRGPYF